jgi:adenylylsulfate kinase
MKGVYVLVIFISKAIELNVGALGSIGFEKGLYGYVGSAQNNLKKRIQRHMQKEKKLFWHVDYLLDNDETRICRVLVSRRNKRAECSLAKKIESYAFPVNGFGSSDCNCTSHLFKRNAASLRKLMNEKLSVISLESEDTVNSGWCVWVTGLPGSGKSVVSEALIKLLKRDSIPARLLSSDALRNIMTPHPTYSLKERDAVYATLVYIARLLTEDSVNVVIDSTGNLRRYRDEARKQIPKFLEIYLECPLKTCVEREAKRTNTYHAPKQIYERAMQGKASNVPGVGQPYEAPLHPEVAIDTTTCNPDECAQKILKIVARFGDVRVKTS